ncbi:MAG TPA: cupredoxin family copper-binding protein [Candidatus Paceibacterota bacterium]|nr:cupredoxin family copper-binding protein [Candidatus Paceibacterota bacterium]
MNTKNITWIVVILIVVVLGLYWYMPSSSTYQSGAPAENNTPTDNEPATINSTEVSIVDYKFEPSPLTIKAGTKVTWTNNDTVPHTVTSDAGTVLNSPRLAPGEKFSYTFSAAGSYDYHCTVHPMMKGGVVVQ